MTEKSAAPETAAADRRRLGARIAGAVVVLVLAWLFAGWGGLLVAVLGIALNELAGPRWVAVSAVAALVVAAIATLVESSSTNIAFSATRPVAAGAGRVAGVLVLVALAGFVARERGATDRHEGSS
jgi:hypothetical protein